MSTTTTDIKPFMDRVERDLLDRPARLLIQIGAGILVVGIAAYVSMDRWAGASAERFDGVVAIAALLGGILIIAAIVVRILQRGRREEIRVELTRTLAGIETERARRDMRLVLIIEPLVDLVRRNNIRTEDAAEAAERACEEVAGLRASLPDALQQACAAGQVAGIEMAVHGGVGRPRLVPPPRS